MSAPKPQYSANVPQKAQPKPQSPQLTPDQSAVGCALLDLEEVQAHEDAKSIMALTVEDIHRLSRALGYNILTPQDLHARVERLTTVSVDGLAITLEPGLLTRLKYSSGGKEPFGEFLERVIKRQLHNFVGW